MAPLKTQKMTVEIDITADYYLSGLDVEYAICLGHFFVAREDAGTSLGVPLETLLLRSQDVRLASENAHLPDTWLRATHDFERRLVQDLGRWQTIFDIDGRHSRFSPEALVKFVTR